MGVMMNGIMVHNMDVVEATIKGTYVIGKIVFQGNRYFLCQDKYEGSEPDNKFGYKYGWRFNVLNSGRLDSEVVITANRTTGAYKGESPNKPDNRPYLNAPGVGKIYHGDYIKVKVDDYKPKILFKCMLVIHEGKFYLNNDKISSPGAYLSVPKFKGYNHLLPFRISGSGFTNSVTIKEIVERADYSVDTSGSLSAYIEAYPSNADQYKQVADKIVSNKLYDHTYADGSKASVYGDGPITTEVKVKIIIPRRKLLKLNQNR